MFVSKESNKLHKGRVYALNSPTFGHSFIVFSLFFIFYIVVYWKKSKLRNNTWNIQIKIMWGKQKKKRFTFDQSIQRYLDESFAHFCHDPNQRS